MSIGGLVGFMLGSLYVLLNYRRIGKIYLYDEFNSLIGQPSMVSIYEESNFNEIKFSLVSKFMKDYNNQTIGFYSINKKTFDKFQNLVKDIKDNIGRNNIEHFDIKDFKI